MAGAVQFLIQETSKSPTVHFLGIGLSAKVVLVGVTGGLPVGAVLEWAEGYSLRAG
jgi:hypothetical protein